MKNFIKQIWNGLYEDSYSLISKLLFLIILGFTVYCGLKFCFDSPSISNKPTIDPKTTCEVDYMINGEKYHQTITSQYLHQDDNKCWRFFNKKSERPGMQYINTIICSEKDVKIECEEGKE